MSERRAWSILTKSYGGTVSVIRDLTLDECRRTYERLDPWHGQYSLTYEVEDGTAFVGGYGGGCHMSPNDGTIDLREVFGPEDWDREEVHTWDHWPKRDHVKLDDPRHYRHHEGRIIR